MLKPSKTTTGNQVRYRKGTRRASRIEVDIDSGNGNWQKFSVVNLSQQGCNIDSAEWKFRIGESLSVKFAEMPRIRCSVRWVRDGQVGIEFTVPLSAEMVDGITR
ncbi:PilZ domain-containing protein [Sphingorhabdus lacus]|jgi:hypothetical protein|uniref:PilZ domain-containing protein n=1 Tax=Sphingorhabdus lacus TaxID=392610 RepID=A0A6I6L6D3_9SPHN|nr:PilZ domain-containing protein [Sphingorhabdus lacus]